MRLTDRTQQRTLRAFRANRASFDAGLTALAQDEGDYCYTKKNLILSKRPQGARRRTHQFRPAAARSKVPTRHEATPRQKNDSAKRTQYSEAASLLHPLAPWWFKKSNLQNEPNLAPPIAASSEPPVRPHHLLQPVQRQRMGGGSEAGHGLGSAERVQDRLLG